MQTLLEKKYVLLKSISGDITKIVGQTLTKSTDSATNASISSVEIFTRDKNNILK